MATYANDLRLKEITTGDEDGTWGTSTNTNLSLIADAFSLGTKQMAADADETFTMPDATADGTRSLYLKITSAGSLTATRTVTLAPNTVSKVWIIENATTGSQSITIAQGSGGSVTIANGTKAIVVTDGAGAGAAVTLANPTVSLATGVTGTLPVANGGTGATSLTANNVILGNGTSAVQFVAPGTSGNVLTSNGTTWSSAVLPAGGLTYVVKTSNYTTQDKEGVLADTSGGAFTVTLPATPATGAQVVVADSGSNWGTNNLTVGRNGSTIGGLAQDLVCDITGASVQLVYDGSTWEVYAQIGGNGGNAATQPGNNAFTGANTFYNATGQTFGTATSTQDGLILAGRAGGSSSYRVTLTPPTLSASRTLTLPDPGSNEMLGYLNIPQNSKSAAYTLVLTDSGKHIFHPSADTTARTFTIPANSSVAFPIGTAITFINQNGAGVITIAITTDTMRLAGAGTTGSRTLAANGVATAIKVTSTEWIISGTGLT